MSTREIKCPSCGHGITAFVPEGITLFQKCPGCSEMIDLQTGEIDHRKKVEPRGLVVETPTQMPRSKALIIGAVLAVLGLLTYLFKAQFAQIFLAADLLDGKWGMWEVDIIKINAIIFYAGILVVAGIISLVIGLTRSK